MSSFFVTICQLPDDRTALPEAWERLVAHQAADGADLVVLNEVPFDAWFGTRPTFDRGRWDQAVDRHRAHEATWYAAAPDPPTVRHVGDCRLGLLTCTELWAMDWASAHGKAGAGFGGRGGAFAPDGDLPASTSDDEPFVTVRLDLAAAEHAKTTYPRSALWTERWRTGRPDAR